MTDYYAKCMEEGHKYQDFVCYQLYYKLGIPLILYGSRKSQFEIGESITGFEIKYDGLLEKTGNLFIETQERTNNNLEYVPSGIFRKDNSWMYVIGNYNEIFLFGKKHLKLFFEKNKKEEIEGINKTSKGFLVTKKVCEEALAVNILKINNAV